MIIVSQNEEVIVNFDNIEFMYVVSGNVYCNIGRDKINIGSYSDNEIAKDILRYISNNVFDKKMIKMPKDMEVN